MPKNRYSLAHPQAHNKKMLDSKILKIEPRLGPKKSACLSPSVNASTGAAGCGAFHPWQNPQQGASLTRSRSQHNDSPAAAPPIAQSQ